MESDLSQISQTLVLGAFLAISFEVLVRLWQLDWKDVWKSLGFEIGAKDSVTKKILVHLSITFVLGMGVEGLAHQSKGDDGILGLKCHMGFADSSEIRSRAISTGAIDRQLSTPEVAEDLCRNNVQEFCQSSGAGALKTKEQFENDAGPIFYAAKNAVFRNTEYFEELREFEKRASFASSIALISGFTALASFFLAMPKGRRRKYLSFFAGASLIWLVADRDWEHQEEQFSKRVFGYYSSLLNSPVESDTVPSRKGPNINAPKRKK